MLQTPVTEVMSVQRNIRSTLVLHNSQVS